MGRFTFEDTMIQNEACPIEQCTCGAAKINSRRWYFVESLQAYTIYVYNSLEPLYGKGLIICDQFCNQ